MTRLLLFLLSFIFVFAVQKDQNYDVGDYQKLSDDEKRSAANALKGIDLLDENLEITMFASEPMMSNPTNMDIDDKGRIWVCEAYNYRNALNPRNPYNKKGDRILILEDTDKDGKADKQTVFYQGEDINAALGIAVLGNKIYVSCSPNVYVFTDNNADDVPDNKEVLFSGIKGNQHDHGMHAFIFGHDGKLYFNFGNAGEGLTDKNGNVFKDDRGLPINNNQKPYQEGMVFSSNEDGSNLEILGWNFRNNYELAQDSYGRMWQSDNDDDGNRSTRINYVMDYGNYGYKDEMTKADWRVRRTNMEDSVYKQHWHLNDPGVVPNLLQTYAGSPTGILIYEGDLLPKKYQNQLIHCDAGPNVVRSYALSKNGAGFSATVNPILDGSKKDQWFRPSDVTVAPDGSIYVADWYDPGVGGHAMGDSTRGRIFRIAPKGHKYTQPSLDYSTSESASKLLQNPNQSVRYKAFKALAKMGQSAENSLKASLTNTKTHLTARAYWLLAGINPMYINHASEREEEDLRVLSVRMARLYLKNGYEFYKTMASDPSIQVRREVALAIRHKNYPDIWAKMAADYKGNDRWFIEALGTSADGNWDKSLEILKNLSGDSWLKNPNTREMVWRSRGSNTFEYLAQIIQNTDGNLKPQYYRAFDFQTGNNKNKVLLSLLKSTNDATEKVTIFKHFDQELIKSNPQFLTSLPQILKSIKNETDYIDIVNRYSIKTEFRRLHDLVLNSKSDQISYDAASTLVKIHGNLGIKTELNNKKNLLLAINKYGQIDEKPVNNELINLFSNKKNSLEIRNAALKQMKGWKSEEQLWNLMKSGKLDKEYTEAALNVLKGTWHGDIRTEVGKLIAGANGETINLNNILNAKANLEKGKIIYGTYCATCHVNNKEGNDFGPALSLIGNKLGKEGLLNAIINPSEGIGFGYEGFNVFMKNGDINQGIITSKTENDVMIKYAGSGKINILKLKEIDKIEPIKESLMPKYPLSETELGDLIGYLQTLK